MDIQWILLALIILFAFSITFILTTTFFRRWNNAKRYRKIDALKRLYRGSLDAVIMGNTESMERFMRLVEKDSIEREALEQIVCEKCSAGDKTVFPFIREVGLIRLYEHKLVSKSLTVQDRAYAADRLGRMESHESVPLLFETIAKERQNRELVNVCLKAMAMIGGEKALEAILHEFPRLLKEGMVTPKNGEMLLLRFVPDNIDRLVGAFELYHSVQERIAEIVVLDALSRSEITESSLRLAMNLLNHQDPELCVRCLRLISNAKKFEIDIKRIQPFLEDTHWYIRLQAIEVSKQFFPKAVVTEMVKLLKDDVWQIRKAAAATLATIGDEALETMAEIIKGEDQYAKEAICEAIHQEGYFEYLVDHADPSSIYSWSALVVLEYMWKVGFRSGLEAIALSHSNGEIKKNLQTIMNQRRGEDE